MPLSRSVHFVGVKVHLSVKTGLCAFSEVVKYDLTTSSFFRIMLKNDVSPSEQLSLSASDLDLKEASFF